ncbi:MAG: GMC family oxidoreductase [Phormidesmis sp.]
MTTDTQYDIIIIGTGAGGGTLARHLAPSGKRILILERGGFLPREKENWDPKEVYQKGRYYTDAEKWIDKEGEAFDPQTCYWVGGNTKVYGAALLRMREKDFDTVQHKDGISPAWPLKYDDFEPYYTQAEHLFDVCGQRGEDPTEPPASGEYSYPPASHEPAMQNIANKLSEQGLQPFHLPVGLKLNEHDMSRSQCIRCDTCDGFPCLVHAKGDSDVNCIRPIRDQENVTLLTGALVKQLHTSESGRQITAVSAEVNGEEQLFSAGVVVVSCGAINSAALLLRSANDQHPQGLANSSGQVGRNLMKHLATTMVSLSAEPNLAVHQKTIAVSDFYWGEEDFPYPMGLVQSTGNVKGGMLPAQAPDLIAPYVKATPGPVLDVIANHATGWWLQTEDLPEANNRVSVVDGQIHVDYTPNNIEARDRLIQRWTDMLKSVDQSTQHVIPFAIYPRSIQPLPAVSHQCGTCRFGEDPTDSVLNLNCQTHDVDNLYVVDSSFFPSNSGVNPTLTIIANAIRVADHLKERLEATAVAAKDRQEVAVG